MLVKTQQMTILIASFIPKDKLDWFVEYLHEKFKIKKQYVFVYEVEGNDSEYLTTFKMRKNKKIDLKVYFNNATIVNLKNECIFSINGLNRLIEEETASDAGNINYKCHEIDWETYKGKLILCSKGKLLIKNLKKIENNQEN